MRKFALALMLAAPLLANAFEISVDSNGDTIDDSTIEVTVNITDYPTRQAQIENSPWFGDGLLAAEAANAADALLQVGLFVVSEGGGTADGFFAPGTGGGALPFTGQSSAPLAFTAWASGVATGGLLIPEIDGGALAQVLLMLAACWLLVQRRRRDDESRGSAAGFATAA